MKALAEKVMHKRFVKGVILVPILLSLIMPFYPQNAVYAQTPQPKISFQSKLWDVTVTSDYTKSPAGKITDFDIGSIYATATGPNVTVMSFNREKQGASGKYEKGDDKVADYDITVKSLTTVEIKSKGKVTIFNATGHAMGSLSASFEDGYYGPLAAAGTGYAKAAAETWAVGDLAYQKRACDAVSAGDREAELGGSIDFGKGSMDYRPKEGDGIQSGSLAANGRLLNAFKNTFKAEFHSWAKAEVNAYDQGVGIADADVEIDVCQEIKIEGETTSGSLSSRLQLTIGRGPWANLTVYTTDKSLEMPVIENYNRNYWMPNAHYDFPIDEQVSSFNDHVPKAEWGWGSRDWTFPKMGAGSKSSSFKSSSMPLSLQTKTVSTPANSLSPAGSYEFGVAVDDWAEYSFSAKGDGPENITRLKFTITQVDKENGWLLLLLSARYKDGTMSNNLIKSNAFTGKGDLMGMVLPSKANVGDKFYNIGTVTGIESQMVGSELREVVKVSYQEEDSTATATYDRMTGLLIYFEAVSPFGSIRMEAINSSLHSPTLEELQSEITELTSKLGQTQPLEELQSEIADLKSKLGQTQQQLSSLEKTLGDETQKLSQAETELNSLRWENQGLANQLQVLIIALILGIAIPSLVAVILFLYLRRIKQRTAK